MALPNEVVSALIGAANQGGYQIEQSLRFDGESKFSFTPSSTGNRRKFTLSMWLKRGRTGVTEERLFTAATLSGAEPRTEFGFTSGGNIDRIISGFNPSGSTWYSSTTENRYRDPAAWMHIVYTVDTEQATASNRAKVYINGSYVGVWASTSYVPQNSDLPFNNSGSLHFLGDYAGAGSGGQNRIHGYMAEVHYLDGTYVSDASDFGETNADGVWVPKKVAGVTYGTNGFYLDFSNSSNLGEDQSGNGNNWTPSGFTTSGPGTDIMSDTPTKNWCTLHDEDSEQTLTEGSLKCGSSTSHEASRSTFAIRSGTGKWYWEADAGKSWSNYPGMGIMTPEARLSDQLNATGGRWFRYDGRRYYDGTEGSVWGTDVTAGTGSIIGMAYDSDNGSLEVWVDGVSQGNAFTGLKSGQSPNLGSSTSDTWIPATKTYEGTFSINFGQHEFSYPPGTRSGTDYFNTVTWTGNGSATSREISGVGFAPDFVWIKGRSVESGQRIQDRVRGAGIMIQANSPNQEFDDTANVGAFTSDGFTLNTTGSSYNQSGQTYVAWCFKAGGSASSNSNGSQTASVSANEDAGFSIMKWNYSGSSAYTVGHGLSTAPKVLFLKKTDGSSNWFVRHGAVHTGNGALFLNSNSTGDSGSTVFDGTNPTTSVCSFNGTSTDVRGEQICYAFAEKAGVSKFGSYSGTGADQYIECGFKPALVIMKSSANAREWIIKDTSRGQTKTLEAHEINTEAQSETVDFQFNQSGFTLIDSSVANTSGDTLIFMAFAENFTADTGYKSLNSANVSAAAIKDGSKYFNTVLWSGNNVDDRSITGVGFQPDFVWHKRRNTSGGHFLVDAIRGATNPLFTHSASGEGSEANSLQAFETDGFQVGNDSNINGSGTNYVAWNWLANGSGSSNSDGSITSTVSASADSGFSIVTYGGNNSASATVGHGLGVTPDLVIIKDRSTSDYVWMIKFAALDGDILELPGTSAEKAPSSYSTGTVGALTSTTFGFTTNSSLQAVNNTGQNYVAYCFASIDGYSKIGKYIGNGLDDGIFIHLGFKPVWVLIKSAISTADDWIVMDVERSPTNEKNDHIVVQQTNQEVSNSTETNMDFISNGIKLRDSNGKINASGSTYVYMAFAEHPFGGSNVSPAKAE